MNHHFPHLLCLALACVTSYMSGKTAYEGNDGWSLVFLLLAFLNFFVGLGGLLA